MGKISTLLGTFLVQWLAMSAGTWAAGNQNTRPPTEEELGAWVNVLRGAEVALQANKIQTAMTMVAGVAARLDATNMPDEEKQAKFKELLKAVEVAMEEDNKVKAVALIDAMGQTFEQHHRQLRVVQERHLHEQAHHEQAHHEQAHHEQAHHEQAHHEQAHHNHDHDIAIDATDRNNIGEQLKEAYKALEAHEIIKAQHIVRGFYHILNHNKDLASGEKAALFLHDIHETEKYIGAHAAEKAEMALRSAASALQLYQLREGYISRT